MRGAQIDTLFDTPSHARISADEYIAAPESAHKSDLIEGVFVMASPASFRHAQLQAFLLTTLDFFVSYYDLGIVLGEMSAYRLNEDNVYQPDVSFLSRERLHLAGEVSINGGPDLAVEVLSPSSRRYDLVEKRTNYARFGVREYWIVDPVGQNATVLELLDGEWVPIASDDGILRSKVLSGFWLRLEWLFPPAGGARPNRYEVARQQGLI